MSAKAILCVVGLIFLLVLGFLCIKTKEGLTIDRDIATYVTAHRTESRTQFMKTVTFFGGVAFITGFSALLILLFLWRKEYTEICLIFIASLGTGGINHLLKWIFARPRPFYSPLVQEVFYSFPSGHSMVSMAFYLMLAEIIRRKWGLGRIVQIPAILLISLIGLSRIYLGVHWFSDVIGGYLGGFLIYVVGKELFIK